MSWLGVLAALAGCAGQESEEELDENIASLSADGGVVVIVGDSSVILLDGGGPSFDGGVALDSGGPIFPGDGGTNSFAPIGLWHFDDCRAGSTVLVDSSPTGTNAVRSVSSACADGIAGSGVLVDEKKDTIEATNVRAFALSGAVTVAAWINPSSAGQGSVVNKQQSNGLVFELSLNQKKVTFSVTVQKKNKKQLVSSSIVVPLHKWTHVAGVYDGQFVRLFSNGAQVGQVSAPGTIADLSAPIRIGNNLDKLFFPGRIDEVQLFNRALTAFEVGQLSCITQAPSLLVTPANGGAVDPEVNVHFDIAYTNHNGGACQPSFVQLGLDQPPPGINVSSGVSFSPIASGETVHFPVDATATSDADPGPQRISFSIFDFGSQTAQQLSGELAFSLNAQTGCFVRTSRELIMRDLSVVEDPVRSTFAGDPEDPRSGAWTFARVMEQLAPSATQAPALVEQMFRTWLTDQTLNTFAVPARTQMSQLVLDSWPRTSSGALDLKRAPLRLLAILNRPDLRDLSKGKAGEGRFVFGVLDPQGFPLQFTVILEYSLPGTTTADVLSWANQWHALGALPFPSEAYNAALQTLSTRFAGRDALPGATNGSALLRLRTNEIALSGRWELREFTLSPTTGMLVPSLVELTPDTGFINESRLVADFVNQNEAAVLREQHVVPATFEGQPFLGASSFNDLLAWRSSGITNPEARFRFSLNTCNGCHSSEETGTAFLQIDNRFPGSISSLSSFMTGITISDPVTGIPRTLNDLGRRNADLKAVVCGGTASTLTTPLPSTGVARPAAVSRDSFLSKGIGRVH